jgi:hypothetical protein
MWRTTFEALNESILDSSEALNRIKLLNFSFILLIIDYKKL